MASPPANLPNPKKRPSLSVPGTSAKRRKPSTGPSHLRQTSFPPPEGDAGSFSPPASATGTPRHAYSPSPSIDGSFANGETTRGKGKRKRGSAHQDDGRSQTGTSARGGAGKAAQAAAEEEPDDDSDGANDVEITMDALKDNEAAKRQEKENIALLMQYMSEGQKRRYENLRSAKLKAQVVRRLTNQTLSQSVPASVVIAIGGYTKLFISDILDLAMQVQREWNQPEVARLEEKTFPEKVYLDLYPPPTPVYNPAPSNLARPPVKKEPVPVKTVKEMVGDEMGPMLPDHLREALRRYKLGREGGGVGFLGLSLEGRENTAVRGKGRRLFR